MIYDDEASQKKFEPKYRLVRVSHDRSFNLCDRFSDSHGCCQSGLATKVDKASRKLRKERKNRGKKVCQISACPDLLTDDDRVPSSVAPRRPRLPMHRRRSRCYGSL